MDICRMNLFKKYIFAAIFIIWCVLWLNFIARDFYKHKLFGEYVTLMRSDYDGKYAVTYGKNLYRFLKFSKTVLPEEASFRLEGIKAFSIDSRRTIYYLYPALNKENPEYILVYNRRGFQMDGYKMCESLNSADFILKRD